VDALETLFCITFQGFFDHFYLWRPSTGWRFYSLDGLGWLVWKDIGNTRAKMAKVTALVLSN
jgi:hypothetical protein